MGFFKKAFNKAKRFTKKTVKKADELYEKDLVKAVVNPAHFVAEKASEKFMESSIGQQVDGATGGFMSSFKRYSETNPIDIGKKLATGESVSDDFNNFARVAVTGGAAMINPSLAIAANQKFAEGQSAERVGLGLAQNYVTTGGNMTNTNNSGGFNWDSVTDGLMGVVGDQVGSWLGNKTSSKKAAAPDNSAAVLQQMQAAQSANMQAQMQQQNKTMMMMLAGLAGVAGLFLIFKKR